MKYKAILIITGGAIMFTSNVQILSKPHKYLSFPSQWGISFIFELHHKIQTPHVPTLLIYKIKELRKL